MPAKVGDPIFNSQGFPHVLKGKEEESAKFIAEADPEKVQEATRHGYIKGLQPEMRETFNKVMDKVKSTEDPREKLAFLQEQIASLETKSHIKENQILARYLKSELFHVMQVYHVEPRTFEIPFHDVLS
ncbi:MAG: hypothetical protein HYW48_02755 [Deltaproteobacteria bacterium]|nr:hypothetical protein [Deltaproteobacteria bacterium]